MGWNLNFISAGNEHKVMIEVYRSFWISQDKKIERGKKGNLLPLLNERKQNEVICYP